MHKQIHQSVKSIHTEKEDLRRIYLQSKFTIVRGSSVIFNAIFKYENQILLQLRDVPVHLKALLLYCSKVHRVRNDLAIIIGDRGIRLDDWNVEEIFFIKDSLRRKMKNTYVRLDQHVATEEGEEQLTKCFNISRVTSVMLLISITGQSFSTGRGETSVPDLPFLFLEGGLLGDFFTAKTKEKQKSEAATCRSRVDIKLHFTYLSWTWTSPPLSVYVILQRL